MPVAMPVSDDILAFAHIGDLHIVDQILQVDDLDFVYVPGDNANNGLPE